MPVNAPLSNMSVYRKFASLWLVGLIVICLPQASMRVWEHMVIARAPRLRSQPLPPLPLLSPAPLPQSQVSGGQVSGGAIIWNNVAFGPPLYPGTSRSTSALGTITSPFSASTPFNTCFHGPLNPSSNLVCRFTDQNVVQFGTNGSGTVNTSGTAVTLATGTNFSSSWAKSLIVINGVTHSIVSATTTTMVLATSAGAQTGVPYTFAGINIDDDISNSNFSSSGGWNDNMCNTTSTACGIKGNSVVWLFGMTKQVNGAFFNTTNGGENPNLKFNGPFGFSRINPAVLYNVSNKNLLTTNTVVTTTTPMTNTPGATFDFATCPGPAAFVPPGTQGTSASILSITFNDTMFSSDISWSEPINGFPGGQGTAHHGMIYTPGVGCQDLDVGPTAIFSSASTASIVANVATVPTTGQPNMPVGQTAGVINASNPNFNCPLATITAQTSSSVSYSCVPTLTNTAAVTLTKGAMIGYFGNIYANCLSSCATATPVAQESVCNDPLYPGGSGTVNTSGATVTWVSGTTFTAALVNNSITIHGTSYTVASVPSSTTLTLGSSAGTQSAVAFSYIPGGIHDQQMNPTGYSMRMAGGAHSLAVGAACFWQIGSTTNLLALGGGTSSWSPGNAFNFAGHPTDAVTHYLTTNDPCPNVRVEDPLSTTGMGSPTTLTCFPGGATASGGAHGGMMYPFNDDSTPWVVSTGNSVGFSTPGQMTLIFLQGELWGEPTTAPLPILRFFPSFNSTTSGGFGCTTSQGFAFQHGDGAMWPSDAFASFGNDSQGNPLCSPLVGTMQ